MRPCRAPATRSRMFASPPLDARRRATARGRIRHRDREAAGHRRAPAVARLRAHASRCSPGPPAPRSRRSLHVVGYRSVRTRASAVHGERDRVSRCTRLDARRARCRSAPAVDAVRELAQVVSVWRACCLQLASARTRRADRAPGGSRASLSRRSARRCPAGCRRAGRAPTVAFVVLRRHEALARGCQLGELLGEPRRQAHVGDGCRGLAGDRAQQRALGVAVLPAMARPDSMRPRTSSAWTRSTASIGSPTTVAGNTRGRRRRARHPTPQANAHPRRAESVGHGGRQVRQKIARSPRARAPRRARSASPAGGRDRRTRSRWIHRCTHPRTGSRRPPRVL